MSVPASLMASPARSLLTLYPSRLRHSITLLLARFSSPAGGRGRPSVCPDPDTVKSPLTLYKYLLRQTELLPASAANFYRDSIRRGYGQHTEEDDPERIEQIVQRAKQDAKWIVEKVDKRSRRFPCHAHAL